MKKLLRSLAVFPASIVLVIAVACSSSSSTPGDDAGSSGSSGFAAESGTSGTSGASGTSGGTSGTSGTSGDSAATDAEAGDKACDPAKTDCKAGDVCTDIGRSSPVCRAGCKMDAECTGTPKSGCVILAPGAAASGACIPTCKPFGTDCAAGFTCSRVPEQTGATQTSPQTYCKKTGATALGASCVNDPASCGANADCIFFQDKGEGVDQSTCHTLCDPTHPCDAAKGACYTKDGDTFGFCHDG